MAPSGQSLASRPSPIPVSWSRGPSGFFLGTGIDQHPAGCGPVGGPGSAGPWLGRAELWKWLMALVMGDMGSWAVGRVAGALGETGNEQSRMLVLQGLENGFGNVRYCILDDRLTWEYFKQCLVIKDGGKKKQILLNSSKNNLKKLQTPQTPKPLNLKKIKIKNLFLKKKKKTTQNFV